ncbi:hypothetical protein B0H10DRAFT_1950047 [Mycena sp. CBHHK59/15]|nr:hypothetical protein B0H10DRAFT_1950047 [Mycena sp. CBHHK59/15]
MRRRLKLPQPVWQGSHASSDALTTIGFDQIRLSLKVLKDVSLKPTKTRNCWNAVSILDMLYNIVPDTNEPMDISPTMLQHMIEFERVLQDLHNVMVKITKCSLLHSFLHLHRSVINITHFNSRLDATAQTFTSLQIGSLARVEVAVEHVEVAVENVGVAIEKFAAKLSMICLALEKSEACHVGFVILDVSSPLTSRQFRNSIRPSFFWPQAGPTKIMVYTPQFSKFMPQTFQLSDSICFLLSATDGCQYSSCSGPRGLSTSVSGIQPGTGPKQKPSIPSVVVV